MDMLVEYYGSLFTDCMVIAIETIGLVKFLDNFLFPKKELGIRGKCTLELITCIICAVFNAMFIPDLLTDVFNLFALSLSITQLGYDCIIHGIPKFLEKTMGVYKEKDEKETKNTEEVIEVEGK